MSRAPLPETRSTAAAPAPTLRELQSQLQAAIITGDETVLTTLLDNSRTSRHTLLAVYQNAYTGRLVEILANDYPLLQDYLGAAEFSALARGYIAQHPSRTQNARWFGCAFPEYVEGQDVGVRHPQLAELAAIEKAVADAFDSADDKPISLADVASIAPEDWPRLVFTPHPSSVMLPLRTNAFDVWRALKDGEPPEPATQLSQDIVIAVWRKGSTPRARALGAEEAMMWIEAGRGVCFEVLCEMLATYDDPDTAPARAAGYLQAWLGDDMLASVHVREG